MTDLMIDIETLGTKPDAVVLSIGAVFFDIETGELGETFHKALRVTTQLKCQKRTIDESTLNWWLNNTNSLGLVDSFDPDFVLSELALFICSNGRFDKKVWGNGPNFDITILENLFTQLEVSIPWEFRNIRDLRTFKQFVANDAPINRAGGVHHNALDDAVAQAKYVLEHTKHLRGESS